MRSGARLELGDADLRSTADALAAAKIVSIDQSAGRFTSSWLSRGIGSFVPTDLDVHDFGASHQWTVSRSKELGLKS